VPHEYAGGLGEEGVAALVAFVEAGGTLICLDQAGSLALGAFRLPLRDVAHDAGADRFFCPGSILRVELDPSQPLSYGMNPQTAGFFGFSSAYEVLSPRVTDGHGGAAPAGSVQVVARYASNDVLISGWLEGGQVIAGQAAVVQARVGGGCVVLLGFPVQHRGQSLATFRLLFNSILASK